MRLCALLTTLGECRTHKGSRTSFLFDNRGGQGGIGRPYWYVFIYIYVKLDLLYTYVHAYIGIFLVNSLQVLVLFDLSSSRSFVSSSLRMNFCVPFGSLDQPLEVAITDDHTVLTLDVYCDYVLEIFGVEFSIDLIPIPMRYVCMIAGIDWLIWFGALIDCKCQLVVIRTTGRGELTIYNIAKIKPGKNSF